MTVLERPDIRQAIETLWSYLVIRDEPEKADTIFLFGSAYVISASRAADLYCQGFAKRILVSGSSGPLSRSVLPASETETFLRVLEDGGVPRSAIIAETRAANTAENIRYGMESLRAAGCEPLKLLLVMVPFHARRCLATFRKEFGDTIELRSCPPEGSFESIAVTTHAYLANRLVGEIDRIHQYAAEGHMVPQDIPQGVRIAAEKIRKAMEDQPS